MYFKERRLKVKCDCGNECSLCEDFPLVPYKIWHCDKCDIDFCWTDNGTRVVIS